MKSAPRTVLVIGCLALSFLSISMSASAQTPYTTPPTVVRGVTFDAGAEQTIPTEVKGARFQRQDTLPVTGGDIAASGMIAVFLIATGVLMARRGREARAASTIRR